MGKKINKNKYKRQRDIKAEEKDDNETFTFGSINESYIILQKLNSSNYTERENITSLLASYEFGGKDEKMREQFLNPEFCRILSDKIQDPFIQVRFNSVSAIINIILCYSEYDIDCIFLFNSGLINHIEVLFEEYITNINNNIKYTEGEQDKINKLLRNTLDLLSLITELYDESKNYNKLDFNKLIRYSIDFILRPDFLSEEVILNTCLFLSNLLSTTTIPINDINNLQKYMEFAQNIILDNSSKANVLVTSCFISNFLLYNK